jgi:hypothetical protein
MKIDEIPKSLQAIQNFYVTIGGATDLVVVASGHTTPYIIEGVAHDTLMPTFSLCVLIIPTIPDPNGNGFWQHILYTRYFDAYTIYIN